MIVEVNNPKELPLTFKPFIGTLEQARQLYPDRAVYYFKSKIISWWYIIAIGGKINE